MKKSFIPRLLLMAAIILISGLAVAQVPNSMNYQGRLTDGAGNPVADGDYSIFFKIYNAGEGGGILWTSDRMMVRIVDGLFSVRLGPFQDNLFSADSSRWLGITVSGDDEISPRTQLITAPYAFHAKSAELSSPIMWSGGCSSHGQSMGWNRYCTDVVDFNTASGYLSIATSGIFTVETAGFYRINAWAANESNTGGLVRIMKNGGNIHENVQNTQSEWHTLSVDLTWYFADGDTFEVDYYTDGTYAYYSYDGNCCYSRLQVSYVGP
ncbi:MAG: hypothetical protein CVT49_06765 [candidate division Zixibacteria bacterium HGW-Zixibacteria-1]|nr:MAG: hypothetical protein CVT49_06765 [candidate division Zixibacteria bacterium HGW-Zixibacteria-1]